MPVYSMTGFSAVQKTTPEPVDNSGKTPARLGLELRSVNSRFLDLTLRLPDELRQHEAALRERLGQSLARGKVELRMQFSQGDDTALPEPSSRQLQRLATVQDQVRAWLPDAPPLTVADALRLAGGGHRAPELGASWLLAQLDAAVAAMQAARATEGERLAQALRERVAQLRELALQAEPLVPQLVEQQRNRFLARWQDALGQTDAQVSPEAAQERALAEATTFALRIDVAEELTRLRSHLDEIDRLLTQGGTIGKRLDFLIQELHREANTLGAKSAVIDLTRVSVDMKVLIEQMREQVQNIE